MFRQITNDSWDVTNIMPVVFDEYEYNMRIGTPLLLMRDEGGNKRHK